MLNGSVAAVVEISGQAQHQDSEQRAAVQQLQPMQSLQPLLAAELLALQRHASERVLQQKVPEQDRSLQSMQRHAEAADDDGSGCGGDHMAHVVAKLCNTSGKLQPACVARRGGTAVPCATESD